MCRQTAAGLSLSSFFFYLTAFQIEIDGKNCSMSSSKNTDTFSGQEPPSPAVPVVAPLCSPCSSSYFFFPSFSLILLFFFTFFLSLLKSKWWAFRSVSFFPGIWTASAKQLHTQTVGISLVEVCGCCPLDPCSFSRSARTLLLALLALSRCVHLCSLLFIILNRWGKNRKRYLNMFQFFFFFYFSLLLILWIEAVTNWVDVKPGVVLGTPEKKSHR